MRCSTSARESPTPAGELVSSGAGIPGFIGVLDKAIKRIIELHGAANIRDGDVFITNDPYFGGVTHLNDVVVAMPVFYQGALVAWTASMAHWNDVGGKTPGSMAVDVNEIFQEGLRLPAVKLFDDGKPLASVFDIIMTNSRLPDFVKGDLWAQVAASRKAEARIRQLLDTYGTRGLSRGARRSVRGGRTAWARGPEPAAVRRLPYRGETGRRRPVARLDHDRRTLHRRSPRQPGAAQPRPTTPAATGR